MIPRRKYHDWEAEIKKGNTKLFYNSTDWKRTREEVLKRDHYECQFFIWRWNDNKHFPSKIELKKAKYVHHIKPLKERPDLALDKNNLISLSFEAHEIVEDRAKLLKNNKKRYKNEEKW